VGRLTSALAGSVYVDANILIYTVERVAPYVQMLDPLWQGLAAQNAQALTSELAIVETLAGPLRTGNAELEALFRRVLSRSPNLTLLPITRDTLDHAARLRGAHPALKTPDATHAATALAAGAATFITNDQGFLRMPGLRVVPPRDLAQP